MEVNLMEESKTKKFTNWVQDSLQAIIVIILTLLILAFVIYSYAKKSTNKDAIVDDSSTNGEVIAQIPANENENNSDEVNTSGEDNSNETNFENNSDQSSENSEQEEGIIYRVFQNDKQDTENDADRSKESATESVETENQAQQQGSEGEITMTAGYGDSLTVLARRATAQYISENDVQNITPAHKIYIEDYLQKRVKNRIVVVGTSVSFSEAQINEAIQAAKSLNDQQLQNLNGYAKYVSGL